MGKKEYKVKIGKKIAKCKFFFSLQELFEKIDQEDDGEVYLKEVVMFLRAVNEDIDSNLKVKILIEQNYMFNIQFRSKIFLINLTIMAKMFSNFLNFV